MKSILYYSDNNLGEPINSIARKYIEESGLPIISVSLKPINFGHNIVLDLKPGIITMTKQIMAGLMASSADFIFYTEHDVLYHPSHFDFNPKKNDIYYYNVNNWRWDYPTDRIITYDHLKSLSGLCASRQLLINHYKKRLKLIEEKGWEDSSREPKWSRRIGHEPGKRRGGVFDTSFVEWKSQYPNIDIRHSGTITRRKCRLEDFIHEPTGWIESTIDKVDGWNLKSLFNL